MPVLAMFRSLALFALAGLLEIGCLCGIAVLMYWPRC